MRAHATGKLTGDLYSGGLHTLTVETELDGELITVAVPLTEWQAGYLSKRLARAEATPE